MTELLRDGDVPAFLADLGLPGIVNVHVHFLPENVLRKVWGYFDQAPSRAGRPRTTGSANRSCAPSCTTPRPACWACRSD